MSTTGSAIRPERLERVYGEFVELVDEGVLRANVAATYRLEQYQEALRHVQNDARNGKILFVP